MFQLQIYLLHFLRCDTVENDFHIPGVVWCVFLHFFDELLPIKMDKSAAVIDGFTKKIECI